MKRFNWLLVLLLVLALVVTACGGGQTTQGEDQAQGGTTGEGEPSGSDDSGEGDQEPAAEPIRIGSLYMLGGAFALYGEYGSNGLKMAVDEINAAGGILGRPVELDIRDESAGTSEAVRQMRSLVQDWGADFIIGVDSSGDALALVDVAEELETPLIITHAATPKVTGENWNPYVFRITTNSRVDAWAAAKIAADLPITKWAGINPDYEFGHVSWEDFKLRLKELKPDVEFVAEEYAPAGAQDFSTHITNIIQSGAEGVFSVEWAGDMVTFVRQAKGYGFFDQIEAFVDPVGGAIAVTRPLAQDYPEGVWVSGRYYFLAHDNPENQEFVQNYHEQFGEYPDYVSHEGYKAVYMLKDAIESVGSTDPDLIIAELEGNCYDSPEGEFCIRAEDHQVFKDLYWGRTKYSEEYGMVIWDDLQLIRAEDVTYPPENQR